MKTKTILLALFALSLVFTSCDKDEDVTPSTNVTTVTKTISGYTGLDVSDPFMVYVTFSDAEEKIQIEANANLQQYITCEKQNDRLVISIDDNVDISGGNTVLKVYITTKQLDAFYGTGASSFQLQNELSGNNLLIELTGASFFTGTVDVNQLNSELTGASGLSLAGNSNSFNIDATGASNMTNYDFVTNYFTADLEGASNVYLTIQQELDVTATGASNVYCKGNGVIVNQNLSGGSQIIKMD